MDRLYQNDIALDGEDLGHYWDLGSLTDTFAQRDLEARANFQTTFLSYTKHNSLHPSVAQPKNYTVQLFTYRKPYEFSQELFLNWLRANTSRNDFLEPKLREKNDYRGNLISPIVSSTDKVTEEVLKKTFGHITSFTEESFTMTGDNKYNPLRWMAPINEIHHHEQGGLSVLLPAAEGQWERTQLILEEFLAGNRSEHIFLEYDIEITSLDQRAILNEYSIFDIYDGVDPSDSVYLQGKTHSNALKYTEGAISPAGNTLDPVLRHSIKGWINTRLVPVNIQVSLMVNWGKKPYFRLSEFILASKNHQPNFYAPPMEGAEGFIPTANATLNPWITDGGTSGNTGWHRHPIDLLGRSEFRAITPNISPVIVHGGKHEEIGDGLWSKRFRGVLDLTNYYTLARANKFFPGQRGYWGNQWVGFEGDVEKFINPTEKHGIKWLGIIFENHGPFKITVHTRTLNIYTATKEKSYH